MLLFPIETTVKIVSKEGKPDRKPYHLYGFRNDEKSIQNNQSIKKTQVCSCIVLCRKAKSKVETSSEKSQDYTQKPQRNFTFMNSILGKMLCLPERRKNYRRKTQPGLCNIKEDGCWSKYL
jgi:hypothetical protein